MSQLVLDDLEDDVRLLQAIAFPGVALPAERVQVALIAPDLTAALDRPRGGLYLPSFDATDEPHLLVLSIPAEGVLAGLGSLREVIVHELAHNFVHVAIPRAPTWLNEGLAQFWQMMEPRYDDQTVIVGAAPFAGLQVTEWAPLSEVVGAGAVEFYGSSDENARYIAAWALVHLLLEQHPDRLLAYEAALREGVDEPTAWQRMGLSTDALDGAMRTHVGGDGPRRRSLPMPRMEPAGAPAAAALSPADVHLLWARIASRTHLDRARSEMATAAQLAPDSVAVALYAARVDPSTADERLTALVEEHPEDDEVLFRWAQQRLARPLGSPELASLEPQFERLASRCRSASCSALVAEYELALHGPSAAQPLADAAVARNPICVGCLVTQAAIRRANKDIPGALDSLSRALGAWPEESTPTEILRRIAELRPR